MIDEPTLIAILAAVAASALTGLAFDAKGKRIGASHYNGASLWFVAAMAGAVAQRIAVTIGPPHQSIWLVQPEFVVN